MSSTSSSSEPTQAQRQGPSGARLHIPAEGEGGVFSESWFPICRAEDVVPGQILSRDFLGGRVIVYRDPSGRANVMSAFCPHLGADLGVGSLEDGLLRCAFHKWGFESDGRCVHIPIGDPVPPGARLFKYPSVERFAMVWAFNGLEPWWQLPDYPVPDEQMSIRARYDVPTYPVDPWVICANTPDWQHVRIVHKVDFETDSILGSVSWTDNSMEYDLRGRFQTGEAIEFRAGIFGTSIFRLHGTLNGEWMAFMTPFGLPRPGVTQNYWVTMLKDDGRYDAAQLEAKHWMLSELAKAFVSDDRPILLTSRYRPGLLIKSDALLARYFSMLRKYPRSHHGLPYIT